VTSNNHPQLVQTGFLKENTLGNALARVFTSQMSPS